MAIHPNHPGLEVDIVSNNAALAEYDDKQVAGKTTTVTKYVEAVPEMAYLIQYKFKPPFPNDKDVALVTTIDDSLTTHTAIARGELYAFRGWGRDVHTAKLSSGKVITRTPRFKRLQTGGEQGAASGSKAYKKKLSRVGTIDVELYFGTVRKISKNELQKTWSQTEQISQAAMKGESKSLQTGLSEERKVESGACFCQFVTDKDAFARFAFKYRSRADLVALGVIPRPLSSGNSSHAFEGNPLPIRSCSMVPEPGAHTRNNASVSSLPPISASKAVKRGFDGDDGHDADTRGREKRQRL